VAVAVLSGITGATATVVSLGALGMFSTRTVQRVERVDRGSPASVLPVTTVRTTRSVATTVAPAVVEVSVTVGDIRRQGSGVVLRADGLILTSSRLVTGVDEALVTWPSGRAESAIVRGHDQLSGLAALTVAGRQGLAIARIDPRPPDTGDTAITVAAWTTAQGPTVTQGVVSATGAHADPDGGRMLGLIETDRPVPDWADGGALVDGEGHLRGVCLSVPDKDTTGWAVPVEVALRVADDLRARGRVDRGWLGIRGSAADAAGSVPAGVTVEEVTDGSPAADADLATGDLVTSVGGERVRSLADVQAALNMTRPGDEVRVTRLRDDETMSVTVTLGDAPR